MEPAPHKDPSSAENLTEEQKKNKLKEERMAKMRNKKEKGEIKEFVPKWVSDPTDFQYEQQATSSGLTVNYHPTEVELLGTLLSADVLKAKVRALNVDTNAETINALYKTEKDKNDDYFARLKAFIATKGDSVLALRRGPVLGMRALALDQGLKGEQIQKFFKHLYPAEQLEIVYYCFLWKKMKLFPAEEIKAHINPQQFREQQESRAKKWAEYKKKFFYENIDGFDDLWEELEEDSEKNAARLKREAGGDHGKKAKVEKEKVEVVEQEEVVDKQALLDKVDREKVKVFDEAKEPLVMIFIGHVDAGKSTTCGAILQLTGTVNDLEMSKLKQEAKGKGLESWYNAYVMDVIEEEKDSGKTIEMGRAYFETQKKRFTILDCPGHKNFVQAMLGGAAQADVASLVISAKPGEFESGFEKEGQTREHAMLARSLGCQYLVVLVNKMDLVNWSQDRFNYIKTNLTPFLELNCGFPADRIYWTMISGLHSINMVEPITHPAAAWWKGDTLFKTFDNMPKVKRSANPILRIPLLDKFRDMGAIITSCKINSGVVRPNMPCVLMPQQKPITIAKVLDTMDQELAFAGAGESVTLHLKGLEEDEIRRGYVICGKQFFTNLCFEFIAEVHLFELLPYLVFGPGFVCMLHLHTALEEVQILSLDRVEENDGQIRKVEAKVLRSGQKGIVKFRSKNLLCLEKYEEFEDLGRFALRKDTITLGSGTVLKYKPAKPELLKNNSYFGRKDETAGAPKAEEKAEEKVEEKKERPQPKITAPVMEDGEDI